MIEISKYKNISQTDYEKICGPDWPSYKDFLCVEYLPDFIINELEVMKSDLTPDISFVGNEIQYREFLKKEYLYVIKNLSVIELGPHRGFHTSLLQQIGPSSHEVVEPDQSCVNMLRDCYLPQVEVIADDALRFLQKTKKSDIVVCFGLLYHLHSPLYLLELIANNCDPDIVLIDCVNSPDVLQFMEERPNIPGNRFSLRGWKTINFNLIVPFEIVSQSMKQLGYKLIKNSNLNIKDISSKSNSWIGMWEKINKDDKRKDEDVKSTKAKI